MERELRKRFPNEVHIGQWLEFYDANGRGCAQPDAYLELSDRTIVFEAKLTQCLAGYTQISDLYSPLLHRLLAKPVVGVQVCRYLEHSPGEFLIEDPREALSRSGMLTWHFLG